MTILWRTVTWDAVIVEKRHFRRNVPVIRTSAVIDGDAFKPSVIIWILIGFGILLKLDLISLECSI